VRILNKVVGTVGLQFGNAALVFLNQVVIIRAYGLSAFGVYQHAYALLMAAPTFLTLGVFNLVFDRSFGARAIAPSLLIATLLAPLGLFFVSGQIVLASILFTLSFTVSYFALVDGAYVKRSAFGGGLVNVCVCVAVLVHFTATPTSVLLLATGFSAVAATFSWWMSRGNPLNVFDGTLATFRDLKFSHYGLFATCGVLSNLTYIVPLSVTQYMLGAHEFGVTAFGLGLARMPLLFSGAFSSIIAKPVATGDTAEVRRLSRMLTTLGMCATALLVLNLDLVLQIAGADRESGGVAMFAVLSFVGATMWGDVDDIIWFSGFFRAELLFKVINVALTAAASIAFYVMEFDPRTYLAMVAVSTSVSYFLRFRFLQSRGSSLTVDLIALVALVVAIPTAYLNNRLLSGAVTVPILIYVAHRVWKQPVHRTA
jgi:hypothetical protein